MSNRKFKVGDVVRYKFSECPIGSEIQCVETDKHNGELMYCANNLWYSEDELELVTDAVYHANTSTNELTQRDLQVLSAMLKEQIAYYEAMIGNVKVKINWLLTLCDPKDADALQHFEYMNSNKYYLRCIRNRKNKLAEIQRKIKRQIANS